MGLTKFCPQIISWNENVLKFIQRIKPAIIKVVGPPGHNTEYLKTAKRMSPDSKWLFRLYRDIQPLVASPYDAEVHARLMEPYKDFYDIFEDYNEIDPRDHSKDPPGPLDIETIKRYNEFSVEVSRIVHGWGKKHVSGCWSNGQPPDEAWQYLKESLEVADYLSIHNYGWETLPDCPQFALRHRKIFDLLPVKKLMILSEVGMTDAVFGGPDSGDLGWRSWKKPYNLFAQEGRAAAVWAWFLDRINEDPYIVGANAYTTGRLKGDNWGTHDFTPRLYKLVGDYILGHPSPDPYLPNGGNNMETDSPLATWREGVWLGNYTEGPTKKTKIVLHSTDGTFTAAVIHFLNPASDVSAHYVIGRGHAGEPKIYQMVREKDIAHHAGDWDMNTLSIGIECADDKLNYLMNAQWRRLVALLKDIVKRYPHIGRSDIILHRDVVATKCPQAIDDEERNEIVAEVFGDLPTPDWEAKYKELKMAVDKELDYVLYQLKEDVNDVGKNLVALVDRLDEMIEE